VELEDLPELDVHCYCLVRVLLSLSRIDPEDPLQMKAEIEKGLPNKYKQLLRDSAHHWALTQRLLAALTNYKPEMAVDFASELNTVDRRDEAYREVLRVYTDRDPESIDLSFVEDVLSKIPEKGRRDWTFVRVLERFVEKGLFSEVPQVRQFIIDNFIGDIPEVLSPVERSLAYARSLQMMASVDNSKAVNGIFDEMVEAWSSIDKRWQQINVGFDLSAIIARDAPELANGMLEMARERRKDGPLAESVFAELYINTLRLAIRAFPDLIKGPDCLDERDRLVEAIGYIPSCFMQCRLLADLALRHHLSGEMKDFSEFVDREVISRLKSCEDDEAYARAVVDIAPCLFQYERTLMYEEIPRLPLSRQDEALGNVIAYLLSKRSIADPVDLESLNRQPDYVTALRICEVLEQMNSDSAIYTYLSCVVDRLLEQRSDKSEICRLIEREALTIAERLRDVVESKLPDSRNITQHNGYKIAAQASLAQLRAGSSQRYRYRASERWRRVAPPWEDIAQAARNIPNAADRALVMAWVAPKMYPSEPVLAHELLEEARSSIDEIPNIIDRAARLQALASSWEQVDDEESAKFLIEEGISILGSWEWDQTRDQVTGQLLELAHSLEPEFAASLTSTVDNPLIQYGLRQELASQDIKREPEKIPEREASDAGLQHLLGRSAHRLLKSFCSGKGLVKPERVISQWLHAVLGAQFKDAYEVMAWSIENELGKTRMRNAPVLSDIYGGMLDSLQMVLETGEILLSAEERVKELGWRSPTLPASLRLFPVGTRAEAIEALGDWLAMNAEVYVKIYDAYFDSTDLGILKHIPADVRVHILTSGKAQGKDFDTSAITQHYKDAWERISDLKPPETHVHVFGIKPSDERNRSWGESPIHQRYYITSEGGIEVGTSVSGLGSKDSHIRYLTSEEAAAIENEHVNRLLVNPPLHFKGERLIINTFTLR
jgi:hypothetical protein